MAIETQKLDGNLLRRLAAVATAAANGRDIWIVTSVDPSKMNETEAFYDLESAEKHLAKVADSTFHVYGPFNTPKDQDDAPKDKIIDISIRVRQNDGKVVTLVVDPEKIDALFWSTYAVERFLAPYYAALYGTEYAAELVQEYRAENVPIRKHCYPSTDQHKCLIEDPANSCIRLDVDHAVRHFEGIIRDLKEQSVED